MTFDPAVAVIEFEGGEAVKDSSRAMQSVETGGSVCDLGGTPASPTNRVLYLNALCGGPHAGLTCAISWDRKATANKSLAETMLLFIPRPFASLQASKITNRFSLNVKTEMRHQGTRGHSQKSLQRSAVVGVQ